jgi:hypothetical protein
MICLHCSVECAAAMPAFCNPCKAAAKLAVSAATPICYHCRIAYSRKTLLAHDGFCGRCIKHKPTERTTARTTIDYNLRRLVWTHYNGVESATADCYCCAELCDVWNFECGHVEAESRGGPTSVDNLRPICRQCNGGMSATNMITYAHERGLRGRINTLDFVVLTDKMATMSMGETLPTNELLTIGEALEATKKRHCIVM